MEELLTGLEKLWSGFLGIVIFGALIAVLFFLGSRFRGRLSRPAAILIFLGPAALLLVMGLIVPAIRTIFASTQDASGNEFVGWANYQWIFDSQFDIIVNSILWIVITPIAATALGLTLALLLDRMRREAVAKSFIFMPMAISFVGASIIWSLIYEYRAPDKPQVGLLSQIVMWLGVDDPPKWLLWQPFNNYLLMVIMVWIQVGFAMEIGRASCRERVYVLV